MKILVTGGAGYIGSVLVNALLKLNYEVTVIDNFMYNQSSLVELIHQYRQNLKIIIDDVRNTEILRKEISRNDIIIPLAAIVGAPACEKYAIESKSINHDSMLQMFSFISKNQYVLMPTTNSAYGKGEVDNLCTEDSKLNPLSNYAIEKVKVENMLQELENFISFRLATVFGFSSRMRLDLLVNNFVYKAVHDGYIILFEANYKRNYIHISDVVQAFLFALKNLDKMNREIFNVGLSSANLSKIELCKVIQKQLPEFFIEVSNFKSDPDQRDYIVSNKKIESLGFKCLTSLEDGVSELISGMRIFKNQNHTNIRY